MPCGSRPNSGLVQIQRPRSKGKPAKVGVVLKDGSSKQSMKTSFNIVGGSDVFPVSWCDNAYCDQCKQVWTNITVPSVHNCREIGTHSIPDDRKLICNSCTHNKEGVCVALKEILPNRPCKVDEGVYLLRSYCPKGHWLPIEFKCPSCNVLTADAKGVTRCSKCGFHVGNRKPVVRSKTRIKFPATKRTFTSEDLESMKRQNRISAGGQRGIRRGGPFTASNEVPPFVSFADLNRDALTLVGMLPDNIDTIIGVARSGLVVANMLSLLMHRPLWVYQHRLNRLVPASNGWRLGAAEHVETEMENVLVVDDTCMTGGSNRQTRSFVSKHYPNALYAGLYVNPLAKVKPDLWVKDLAWPHILEWNMFNSILSPNMALDFDGILCQDCPRGMDDDGEKYEHFIKNARPKYLPRKVPVPLIVTARIEKYREWTLEWLSRYEIRVQRLVMHPAATLQERRKDNIAHYKARHYREWASSHQAKGRGRVPPLMFVESDDRQAREIHKVSQKLVVCPPSGRCYGKGTS